MVFYKPGSELVWKINGIVVSCPCVKQISLNHIKNFRFISLTFFLNQPLNRVVDFYLFLDSDLSIICTFSESTVNKH